MNKYFKEGTYRVTLVIPDFSLVFKFPHPRILKQICRIVVHLTRRLINSSKSLTRRRALRLHWSGDLKEHLVALLDNWNEFIFYYQTNRRPFLEPTYLSIFGLLNICRKSPDYLHDHADLWIQILRIVGEEARQDIHHFDNPDNFSVREGRLLIRDYGGKATQRIILKYGDAIFAQFDPDWIYKRKQ
jgi:hypothetical protein